MEEHQVLRPGLNLLDRYVLHKQIAKGGFSSVWAVYDTLLNAKVAAKCVKDPMHNSMREAEIYRDLSNLEGFATFYDSVLKENCFFIFIERLHSDLQHTFNTKPKSFTAEYVYTLGIQMFSRIETLHSLGFVHRDLKPSQFMSKHGSSLLYLIDFNLSRKFPKSLASVSQQKGGMVGNIAFASLHAHSIEQQTRRDDCESILYILLYFLRGKLPWQGLLHKGRENLSQVISVKAKFPIAELCRGLPQELGILLSKVRSMTFNETPSYSFFISTLETLKLKHLPSVSQIFGILPKSSNSLMTTTFMSSAEEIPKLSADKPTPDLTRSYGKRTLLQRARTTKIRRKLPKPVKPEALQRRFDFCKEPEALLEQPVQRAAERPTDCVTF